MMRSLKKNLILLLIPLLWLLLTTFNSWINNLVIRLVPPTVRSEEEERVVENGSLPTQRVITAELGELPGAAARAGISPPALIVIGDVVRVRDRIAASLPRLEKGVPSGRPKG